ncbi:MAG: hypothetical protein EOP50_15175 [Sphingobacteriales bacterium]|nr:MAG: hypothetical protein EOP50_15175 [Sphingobacteriales bacterium]
MNELFQMGVTLLFLPFAGFALLQAVLSLRQLFSGFRQADQRLQRNSVYMLALCFLALVLLYRLWFWLMWQMD